MLVKHWGVRHVKCEILFILKTYS